MKVSFALIFLSLGFAAYPLAGQNPPKITADVVPDTAWQQTSPESVGYSGAKLEALRGWLKTQATTSMVVVVKGRIIFSYGDISHTTKIASARKSILSMLYGKYVINGTVNMGKTVKELGLDDKQPFLPIEEHATLEHLMTARSGIYLPTGSWGQKDYMPPRGSAYPGTQFMYNNWDFDAAGFAFEKLTGQDIYKAIEKDLAEPLGMQDYAVAKQKKIPTESVHPEFAMYLSTRDMARLGLLMLDSGMWNGKTLVPPDWVRYTTSLITPFRDINPLFLRNYGEPERWGYGVLWWVWDQPSFPGGIAMGFMQGSYSAMGSGGQFITVLPINDMVVVHQVDIDKNPAASVSPSSYMAMLSMITNAKCDGECK